MCVISKVGSASRSEKRSLTINMQLRARVTSHTDRISDNFHSLDIVQLISLSISITLRDKKHAIRQAHWTWWKLEIPHSAPAVPDQMRPAVSTFRSVCCERASFCGQIFCVFCFLTKLSTGF